MRVYRHIAVFLSAVLFPVCLTGQDEEVMLVSFWNLENFFDYEDGGGGGSDREFSSGGERHWTKSRYWKKCHGVAKTVLWMADSYGKVPDVMGVAEVENRGVMQSVLNGTLLKKYGYRQVHEDSPDARGIDVALIYREDVFGMAGYRAFHVSEDMDGKPMKTRDILYVCLEDADRERYHFLVNHHPSKYGGASVSVPKRLAAMDVMVSVCDSLVRAGEKNIICMGDFNDTPDGDAFRMAGKCLVNMAVTLHRQGRGTIRYGGKWELIDMFLVSADVAGMAAMDICFPHFAAVPDGGHSGWKPLRTYTGPRYTGGISDHLPVMLRVNKY